MVPMDGRTRSDSGSEQVNRLLRWCRAAWRMADLPRKHPTIFSDLVSEVSSVRPSNRRIREKVDFPGLKSTALWSDGDVGGQCRKGIAVVSSGRVFDRNGSLGDTCCRRSWGVDTDGKIATGNSKALPNWRLIFE